MTCGVDCGSAHSISSPNGDTLLLSSLPLYSVVPNFFPIHYYLINLPKLKPAVVLMYPVTTDERRNLNSKSSISAQKMPPDAPKTWIQCSYHAIRLYCKRRLSGD